MNRNDILLYQNQKSKYEFFFLSSSKPATLYIKKINYSEAHNTS